MSYVSYIADNYELLGFVGFAGFFFFCLVLSSCRFFFFFLNSWDPFDMADPELDGIRNLKYQNKATQ